PRANTPDTSSPPKTAAGPPTHTPRTPAKSQSPLPHLSFVAPSPPVSSATNSSASAYRAETPDSAPPPASPPRPHLRLAPTPIPPPPSHLGLAPAPAPPAPALIPLPRSQTPLPSAPHSPARTPPSPSNHFSSPIPPLAPTTFA